MTYCQHKSNEGPLFGPAEQKHALHLCQDYKISGQKKDFANSNPEMKALKVGYLKYGGHELLCNLATDYNGLHTDRVRRADLAERTNKLPQKWVNKD